MNPTLLRSVLRMAGLVALVLGAAELATDVAGFMHPADDDHASARPAPHDALYLFGGGRSSLHLLLLGGILYVLPAAPLSRKRRVVSDGCGTGRLPGDIRPPHRPRDGGPAHPPMVDGAGLPARRPVRRVAVARGVGKPCQILVFHPGDCDGLGRGVGRGRRRAAIAAYVLAPLRPPCGKRASSQPSQAGAVPSLLPGGREDAGRPGGPLSPDLLRWGVRESGVRPGRLTDGGWPSGGRRPAPRETAPAWGGAAVRPRRLAGGRRRAAQASDLVVFRIGRTEGFWWEIRHVVSACDPRRVLIYLPKKDRGKVYSAFWERSADVFPQQLPFRTGDALFLGFDADWSPHLLGRGGPTVAAGLRGLLGGRAPVVREALNEALCPLGLDARGPCLGGGGNRSRSSCWWCSSSSAA